MNWGESSGETPLEEKDIHNAKSQSQPEVLTFFPQVPEDDFKLARKAVEFSNHKGGTIFIGISGEGKFTGVGDPSEVEVEVGVLLEDRIEGDFRYHTFTYDIDGCGIIEVRIKTYETLPCSVDGKFYKWKPVPRPLSPREVRELMLD
ncbi:AlbA family DNA-binding domain-containing protein [Haloarcula sp. CGMCC 1.6347]|uniref:AlbA family DNA-binding domain-containing protein n=1 Tax=Haloarcula sp. CGMCC 1.6347 TaxID=3111455 RepID=UPI00300F5456